MQIVTIIITTKPRPTIFLVRQLSELIFFWMMSHYFHLFYLWSSSPLSWTFNTNFEHLSYENFLRYMLYADMFLMILSFRPQLMQPSCDPSSTHHSLYPYEILHISISKFLSDMFGFSWIFFKKYCSKFWMIWYHRPYHHSTSFFLKLPKIALSYNTLDV